MSLTYWKTEALDWESIRIFYKNKEGSYFHNVSFLIVFWLDKVGFSEAALADLFDGFVDGIFLLNNVGWVLIFISECAVHLLSL